MKNKLLSVVWILCIKLSYTQTIQLTNLSSNVFCSTGKDTLKFSVNYSNIPANSNIVFYQSTNPSFNPYAGQGDSIDFLNVGANTSGGGGQVTTTCPKILGIFIDACNDNGRSEPANEYLVITSGQGFQVSSLQVDVPNNVAPSGGSGLPANSHNDINMGSNPCAFGTPSATLMNTLRVGACNASNLIAAGPGDFVPANALVIIFTGNGTDYPYNFNKFCQTGQKIYILQNACTRDTSSGAFANNAPSTTPCSNASNTTRYRYTAITYLGCTDGLTYDRCGLPAFSSSNPNAGDGNYIIRLDNTDTSSVSNGGILNNAADKCNGVVLDSIIGNTIIKYPIPNDGGANPATNFCNTGVHYIKAITHPNGSQPVSNAIQFQLVCLDVATNVSNLSICSGNNAAVSISSSDPNATFSWTVSGGAGITGASAGSGNTINQTLTYSGSTKDSLTYNITAKDGSCTKTTSIKVVVSKCNCTIPFDFGAPSTSVCIGGNISLDATTAYDTYHWNTGATTHAITITQPGRYWVDVFKNGCKGTDTIDVLQIDKEPKPNLGADINTCSPLSQLLSTGKSNTTWYYNFNAASVGTGASYTATQFGTYVAKVSNSCGDVYDTIVITQTNSQPAFNLGNDTTYCGPFSRTLSTGNAATVWNTGDTAASITVTQPGKYYATINVGCGIASDTIVINQGSGVSFDFGSPTTSVCVGGNISLDASTAYDSYHWNTGATTHFITITQPGIYWVDVFKNGCKASDTIQVLQITKPAKPSLGRDTSYCGSFSQVLSTGDTQTDWYRNQTLIASGASLTVNQGGTYVAKVSNSCGSTSDTLVISSGNALTVDLGRDTAICTGNSITLKATVAGNNITYSWNTGATTSAITVNQFGKYDVTVSNGVCTVYDTILVDIVDPPVIASLGPDTSFCGNFSFSVFTGDAGTIWSTGVVGPSINVTQAGTYIAENRNQCGSAKDTIVIKQYALPQVDLGKDSTVCDSIQLSVGNGTYVSILWSTGDTTPSIIIATAGLYKVTVTNANCANTDSVRIRSCFYDVYIPNAFSPNNDNVNDVFIPLSYIKGIQIIDFQIFNRWGEKVYEAQNFTPSNNPNDNSRGWNGIYKGEPAQVDEYVYYFSAKMPDGQIKIYKGTFALLR